MERYLQLFDVNTDWRRPLPAQWWRTDVLVALATMAIAALFLELLRSIGALGATAHSTWTQYAILATASTLMLIRRRFPVTAGVVATVHLLVASTFAPLLAGQLAQQLAYFVALYSAVAWARDRVAAAMAVGAMAVLVALWSLWFFALGQGLQVLADYHSQFEEPSEGFLPPIPANLLLYALNNILFFGGAVALGVGAWRSAHRHAVTEQQAATISTQSQRLRDSAILGERVRIARELHDVVAHHVASIGVQAAAARKQLPRDPARAAAALQDVESASHDAVTEMRALLGTLRQGSGVHNSADPGLSQNRSADRRPEPTLTDIPELVTSYRSPQFQPELQVIDEPSLPLASVPPPIGLSLYRTVQEALANVRRHSTAHTARVTVRTGRLTTTDPNQVPLFAEVEIVDDGRPLTGTSGSGLGLLGMRERVASHRGTCEIGPRITGGYRVRVRIPVRQDS